LLFAGIGNEFELDRYRTELDAAMDRRESIGK